MNDPSYNNPIYLYGTELAMPDMTLKKLYQYLNKGYNPPPDVLAEIRICNLDRDTALLSMDRDKILNYANKYGVNAAHLPGSEEDFWSAVHIARTSVESLPMEKRTESKKFLIERKIIPLDDGAVPT